MTDNARYAAAAALIYTSVLTLGSTIAAHEGLYVHRGSRTVYGWEAFWGVFVPGAMAAACLTMVGVLAARIIKGGRR